MAGIPLYLSLDDVLLLPQRSPVNSRSEVDLSWKIDSHSFPLPIISINMDCVTGVDMAIALGKLGGLSIIPRFDTIENQAAKVKKVKAANVFTAAAIGVREDELKRAESLVNAGVDHLSVDVAHGHLEKVLEFVSSLRHKFPKTSISAGVVGTKEAAVDLYDAGADIIRVGLGPGTICTTRLQTGCGVPQFTAIQEVAKAARLHRKIFWADGGTRSSGDIVKCLAAGASAVVVGSQLAGTNEAPSEIVEIDGNKFKKYNASTSAIEKQKQYQRDPTGKTQDYLKHIEGVESLVPYRGPLKDVVESLSAGIRSGYSYCAAFNTPQLWQNAQFVRVSPIGYNESASHHPLTT